MSLNIIDDRTNGYPTYLLVVTYAKLYKITNRISYYFKRKMWIENDIYIMLYNYDYATLSSETQLPSVLRPSAHNFVPLSTLIPLVVSHLPHTKIPYLHYLFGTHTSALCYILLISLYYICKVYYVIISWP